MRSPGFKHIGNRTSSLEAGVTSTAPGASDWKACLALQGHLRARLSQIVQIFRPKLESGRKNIFLQVVDGSSAGDGQHDR